MSIKRRSFYFNAFFLPCINKKIAPFIVCLVAGLFYLFQNVQANMINSLNLTITKAFHLSASQLGYVSSGYIYANVFFLMIAGILTHYFSKRLILIMACATNIFSTILFAIAQAPWQIFVATFITGLAGTFSLIACMQLARYWFSPKRLATIVGFIGTLGGFGGIIAQIPFTMSIHHVGWRFTLFIDALFGVVILCLIIFFVEDSPRGSNKTPVFHKKNVVKNIKAVLSNGQNWLIGIYIALMTLPSFILGALWGNRYLVQAYHFGTLSAASITSIMYVGGLAGGILLGYLSDFFATRKRIMQICSLFCLCIISYFLFSRSPSIFQFYYTFFSLGLVTGTQGLGYTLAAENNDKNRVSTAQGLVATLLMLGGFTQLLFSWIIQLMGKHEIVNGIPFYSKEAYASAMLIFPIAYFLALLLAFFLKEKNSPNKRLGART